MSAALPPPPPRPEEKKEDSEDEKKEGEGGKLPNLEDLKKIKDKIIGKAKTKKKYPKAVEELLAARKGYGNYHFNLTEQEDFISELRGQFPKGAEGQADTWVITGTTADEAAKPVAIRVESGNMALVIGDEALEIKTKADLYDAVDNRAVAGLLPALDAWRRMIANGPKKFGESYYMGTMPLGGERPLRDCMVGIDGELEVRWMSHPETHKLEVVEVFADRDLDPAELWIIRDKGDSNPILDLRYGVESSLRIRVKTWRRPGKGDTP